MSEIKSEITRQQGYFIDTRLLPKLDKAKKVVLTTDSDRVFVIDGREGSGKSLLAIQVAKYLDESFNMERICFTGDDFTKAIGKAHKGQAIVFDEAFNGLSSRGALSSLNKKIIGNLMECRQKNLFVIIVLPTIFMLEMYVALFRSNALFHVYFGKNSKRGFFKLYNQKDKRILYRVGKKLMSYSKPYVRETYRFFGNYPIDEEEYRKKKLNALHDKAAQLEDENDSRYKYERDFLILLLYELQGGSKYGYKKLAEYISAKGWVLSEDQVGRNIRIIQRMFEKGQKIP